MRRVRTPSSNTCCRCGASASLATRSNLAAASTAVAGPFGRLGVQGAAVGPLRPIPIGPGLLTYLDRQKRERFLTNWHTALRR